MNPSSEGFLSQRVYDAMMLFLVALQPLWLLLVNRTLSRLLRIEQSINLLNNRLGKAETWISEHDRWAQQQRNEITRDVQGLEDRERGRRRE